MNSQHPDIHAILRRYWGYSEFRPMQREIIESVLEGHDTLGLLPTGGGKSITFQIPAMALDGLTIVVTPLISLMKDQVDNLRAIGIQATYLHSGMTRRELRVAVEKCLNDRIKLLYVSPEKLQSPTFASITTQLPVSLIVVDEAHCISQWGYDFRPSYLKIAALRDAHPRVPVLALTASATPAVARDIMKQLRFPRPRLFARSFHRSNLSYLVRHTDHKETTLLRVLRNTGGSAIVYTRSRRRTREIAELLAREGISAAFYHAGLDPVEKESRQDLWKQGLTRVMVATNAFGMGIDKPDVRVVAHVDVPSSLEEYYQEAGRAGRDGLEAFAVLIVTNADKGLLTRRVAEAFPPKEYVANVYERVSVFLNIAVGEGLNTVNDFDIGRFCFVTGLKAVAVASSLKLLQQSGYIEYVEDLSARARVQVLMRRSELYELRLQAATEAVLNELLRSYGGLFADYVNIDEGTIASHTSLSADEVYQALLALSRMHVIHYVPRRVTPCVVYTQRREETRHIQLPVEVYRERRQCMEQRIRAMQKYAFDDGVCRVDTMLRYFGEDPGEPCGKCDVCRSRAVDEATDTRLSESILYQASHPGGRTVAAIASHLGVTPERVAAEARPLLDSGRLRLVPPDLLQTP